MLGRSKTLRLLGAGLAALCALVTASCGRLDPTAGVGPSVHPPTPQPSASRHKGDISPRRVAHPTSSQTATTRTPTATPTPTVTLTPLPQPAETYAAPKMPAPPKDSEPELVRIRYALKKIVWSAVGEVNEDKTSSSCTRSNNDLVRIGDYDFTCDVKFKGVRTRFKVTAEVKTSKVDWRWSAAELPVSESKAVYEVTRQAFKPARATCDLVDLELVKVGTQTGITCWVTDIYNERLAYRGKLLTDGAIAFRPDS
ncbi:hypothetical protein [Actinopolymorpha alba]|uniref:hypothetical protein n=1 Tax=Actinopolymorpha alba TaxID=533267 RepID=UPI0003A8E1FE|nr:hypothetical protein [Actinopolymorpha alba]